MPGIAACSADGMEWGVGGFMSPEAKVGDFGARGADSLPDMDTFDPLWLLTRSHVSQP